MNISPSSRAKDSYLFAGAAIGYARRGDALSHVYPAAYAISQSVSRRQPAVPFAGNTVEGEARRTPKASTAVARRR